jgi:hypothetical protein
LLALFWAVDLAAQVDYRGLVLRLEPVLLELVQVQELALQPEPAQLLARELRLKKTSCKKFSPESG